MEDSDLMKNEDGSVNYPRSLLAGAAAGSVGAFFASPFYMVGVYPELNCTRVLMMESLSLSVSGTLSCTLPNSSQRVRIVRSTIRKTS